MSERRREIPPSRRRPYRTWLVTGTPIRKREPDPEVLETIRRIEQAKIRAYLEKRKPAS